MAVQGAQEAMAVQGAQEAMAVQGAQEAMAGGLPAGTLLLPPKKNYIPGIRSPPGLDRQDSTWTGQGQDSPPGLNRQEQDSPQEQEALLG